MRKNIISTIIVFTFILNINAQCPLPYKSPTEFQNDTIAFINYNFGNRSNCYVNKTFGLLIQDLKLPIKSFFVLEDGLNFIYKGVKIYFSPSNIVHKQISNHVSPTSITIYFSSTFSPIIFDKLFDVTERNLWTIQIETFLKNFIVDEIIISKPKSINKSMDIILIDDKSFFTKTYIAKRSITLKPSFKYTPSSGSRFNAKIVP